MRYAYIPFLLLYLLASVGGGVSYSIAATNTANEILTKQSYPLGFSISSLKRLYDEVTPTGVGRDAISALMRPQFVSVSDASLSMDDDEIVFIVEYPEGLTRIYPQRILVWHELVNDVLPDVSGGMPVPGSAELAARSYCVSYSPLTGTVVAFRSLAGGYSSSFGVVGSLLNNNTMLYDRISASEWSQLLGLCIEGPLRGKRLERIPVLWATWRGAREYYQGKAQVLSRSTGYKRSYGKDPYGNYQTADSYYHNNVVVYPVSRLDSRLPLKEHVLGIEQEELMVALRVGAVKQQRVVNFMAGIVPMVAFYDEAIDTVRIFDRRLDGPGAPAVTFSLFEGKFVDSASKSQWDARGKCTYGRYREKVLSSVYAIDTMWFAWAAFFRNTQVVPALEH